MQLILGSASYLFNLNKAGTNDEQKNKSLLLAIGEPETF